MTEFQAQSRPDDAAQPTRSKLSRHRAQPAKPASALARFGKSVGSTGRRAAVVAAACAVIVGVGAAGHASETAARNASAGSSTQAASTADPLAHLDVQRVRVDNQAVIPAGVVAAPPAEVKPA